MSAGGLSSARLTRMHDVMAGYVERGDLPGLVTAVSRRGATHVDVIGMQALDGSAPMRRDTIFRISSMTKPIMAVATLLLIEECKLRLQPRVFLQRVFLQMVIFRWSSQAQRLPDGSERSDTHGAAPSGSRKR